MNFCINCKHIQDRNRTSFEKCAKLTKQNPVTGEPDLMYCSTARSLGFDCGPEGKLFEQAPDA